MRFFSRLRSWLALTSPMSRFAAARAAAQSGDDDEAYRLFNPLLEADHLELGLTREDFTGLLGEMAENMLRLNKLAEAQGVCHRALADARPSRHTGGILLTLAKAEQASGETTQALEHLAKGLAIQERAYGKNSNALVTLLCEVSVLLDAMQRPLQAMRILRRARKLIRQVQYPLPHLLPWILTLTAERSQALGRPLGRLAALEATRQKLLDDRPVSPQARRETARGWLSLAAAYGDLGRFAASSAAIEQARRIGTRSREVRRAIRAAEAGLAMDRDETSRALAIFRELCAEKALPLPAFHFNQIQIGRLLSLTDPEAAQCVLTQTHDAVRGTEQEAYALFALGGTALKRGDFAAAEAHARASLALHAASDESIEVAQLRQLLGQALLALGKKPEAAEAFERAETALAKQLLKTHPMRVALNALTAGAG